MHRLHHKILGHGTWVWVDERRVHTDKPLQVGGVPRVWQWRAEMPGGGGEKGKVVPSADKGVKMLEMAQFKVFSPDVKNGGAGREFPVPLPWMGGHGAGGHARRGEDVGVVADTVVDHGGWRPAGGRMPDCYAALPPAPSLKPPASAQPEDPRNRTRQPP